MSIISITHTITKFSEIKYKTTHKVLYIKCIINIVLAQSPTTLSPTSIPSATPTFVPSASPTLPPTMSTTAPPSPSLSPSISPTLSPTMTPSLSPTNYQKTYKVSFDPTTAPTNAPNQRYNEPNKRLEFYIYYNDTNGINVIMGKWMKEELLHTYDEITGTSHKYHKGYYDEGTEWRMGGILNLTFCVTFNEYYHGNNEDSNYCKRFKEYGFHENMENNERRRLQQRYLNVE